MSVNVCKSSPLFSSLLFSLLSSHSTHFTCRLVYITRWTHIQTLEHTRKEEEEKRKSSSLRVLLLTQREMSVGLPAGCIHCKLCVHLHFSWPFVNCVSPLSNRSFRLLSCHTCRHSLHHHQKLFFIFTDSSPSLPLFSFFFMYTCVSCVYTRFYLLLTVFSALFSLCQSHCICLCISIALK